LWPSFVPAPLLLLLLLLLLLHRLPSGSIPPLTLKQLTA
jgi:hypothetical protein